jgi:hypothetical protein
MNIRDMQARLVERGYPVAIDGAYGPKTRASVLAAMTDPPDVPITAAAVVALATKWTVDPAALWAVRDVEATGRPFIDGRPTILFEPHRFSKATGHRFDAGHPTISYPNWGARPYPSKQIDRWNQLLDAVALDVDAAFASASYGAFQILGENYGVTTLPDSMAFALEEASGEDKQLQHFGAFVGYNGLVPFLRRLDWAAFAKGYNGTAYKANRYDERLAAAYAKRKAAA